MDKFTFITHLQNNIEEYLEKRYKISTERLVGGDAETAYEKLAYASSELVENILGIIFEEFQ